MTDFEKICSFDALYRAHLKAKKGKARKKEVLAFELNLNPSLEMLRTSLKNGTYRMSGYRYFRIYEPKGRDIYETCHIDKIVMHALCDEVLLPRLSPHFIYDNAACQVGKGTHFAMRRFTEKLVYYYKHHGRDFYVLKCDISAYFASIHHGTLEKLLRKLIKDEGVMDLLSHFIASYEDGDKSGVGLPLGNQTSQWFALFYLSEFDHYVKESLRIKGYMRYMDDFLLIHEDKIFLLEVLEEIGVYLEFYLGLTLNPKTAVIKASAPVEFLGWRFFIGANGGIVRRLKAQSKMRYKRGIGDKFSQFKMGAITFVALVQSVESYDGHLRHGNAYRLRMGVMGDLGALSLR